MKKIILFLLLIMSINLSYAQSYSLEGVKRTSLRNSGVIEESGIIKGYYMFYFTEKASKNQNVYEVVILDENLEEVVSKSITLSKNTVLLQAEYNGSSILMKFATGEKKKNNQIMYMTINNEGEFSKKNIREMNNIEMKVNYTLLNDGGEALNLNKLDENIFLDITQSSNSKKQFTYTARALNNKGEEVWQYESEGSSDAKRVTPYFLTGGKNGFLLTEEVAKSKGFKNMRYRLIAIDNLGKKRFHIDLKDSRFNYFPNQAIMKDREIIVIGDYYNVNDKLTKAESLGVFVKILDQKGKQKKQVFLSWAQNIKSKLPTKFKKSIDKYSIFTHDIKVKNNGEIMIVGELFRRQANAAGIGLKTLELASGNNSDPQVLTEIKVENMIILHLDKSYKVKDIQILEKKPKKFPLVNITGPINIIARYAKAMGAFDYTFTQNNEDNSSISVAYLDKEKNEDSRGKKWILNFASYSDGNTDPTEDEFTLLSKSSQMIVMRAKPGHVLLYEYFKKERKIEMRLEPINF